MATVERQTIRLRPYQREAVDAVHAAAAAGVQAPAVGLPTGTGKTIVFSQLAEERAHLGRTLILAHRDELLRQAADKYREINPRVDVGFVQAGMNDVDHDVVVASVQSLCRPRRLEQFPFDLFATVVIDEAHHAVAETYRRIIDARAPGTLLVGVSATLERGDRVGLGAVWEQIVYFKDIREMIAAGYLVDVRAFAIKLAYDMGKLRVSRGDFVGRDVEGMLDATKAYSVAANAYREHAPGRKAIVFTPTVAAAHHMAATFTSAGVPAEAVDGQMPIEERRQVLDRFATGETLVVANAMVLTEGFDEPPDPRLDANPIYERCAPCFQDPHFETSDTWTQAAVLTLLLDDLDDDYDPHDLSRRLVLWAARWKVIHGVSAANPS